MQISINNFIIEGISCDIVLNSDNNQLYVDIKHKNNDKVIQENLSNIKNIHSFRVKNKEMPQLQNAIVHQISFIPSQIILIIEPQEEKINEKS